MKRERRQPTRREWAAITSRRPVVRRIPKESRREKASAGLTIEARRNQEER